MYVTASPGVGEFSYDLSYRHVVIYKSAKLKRILPSEFTNHYTSSTDQNNSDQNREL